MSNNSIIYEDNEFIVSQCSTCNIPGYLILETKHEIDRISKLDKVSKSTLGVLLGKLEDAIYRIVNPENIYFTKFGEECKKIHFHIFPRTKAITEKYLANVPNDKVLSGPQIFDWARKEFKMKQNCLSKETQKTADLIKLLIKY